MNKRMIVALLLSGLLVVLAGLAMAGFEPTPFHRLINKLDSVENVLDARDDQLSELLMMPTGDMKTNALVNKLNAMANTLWNQNDRVNEVLDSVPFDQEWPDAFFEALIKVQDEASSIADRARMGVMMYMDMPPEDAFLNIQDAAQAIIESVPIYDPLPS